MGTTRDPAVHAATATRRAVLLLAALNAVSAAGGGVALATGAIDLGQANPRLPFDSPVFRGVALLVLVALPQAVLTVAALRNDPRTPRWGMAYGALLVGWILVEVAFLQAVAALHGIFLVIGVPTMSPLPGLPPPTSRTLPTTPSSADDSDPTAWSTWA